MVTAATTARRPYHHGNLRAALIRAGLDLTRRGGPEALGLRDVTRRVGVSPNAAYRHFADRQALLQAVRSAVQSDVVGRMRELVPPDAAGRRPADRARVRLRAVGLGYIAFAVDEPGWFDLAFGDIAPIRTDGPAGSAADAADAGDAVVPGPLALLVEALDDLAEAGALTPLQREGAEWPCWATVHGFALLALHGPLRGHPPEALRAAAERSVDMIIDGLTGRSASADDHEAAGASPSR